MSKPHKERAHSKFSASGAERWFNCPGSVELSEGVPDKPNVWAEEGTKAHEVLEAILLKAIKENRRAGSWRMDEVPQEMRQHGIHAANFILDTGSDLEAEILVENKVYLDFIHPEMFGTYDGAVLDHFGTLHVFDYKYGAGVPVSPRENLQMIFYGIGLAHMFQYNFKIIRLWIIQPRIKGYDGPVYWDLTIDQLKKYVGFFKDAVAMVIDNPDVYVEGSWCHWCKAKSKCPVKQEAKLQNAIDIFSVKEKNVTEKKFETKENSFKEEADSWRKKAKENRKRATKEPEDFY